MIGFVIWGLGGWWDPRHHTMAQTHPISVVHLCFIIIIVVMVIISCMMAITTTSMSIQQQSVATHILASIIIVVIIVITIIIIQALESPGLRFPSDRLDEQLFPGRAAAPISEQALSPRAPLVQTLVQQKIFHVSWFTVYRVSGVRGPFLDPSVRLHRRRIMACKVL